MNELIQVTTKSDGTMIVSCKEVYEFLGYDRSQWKRWATTNIEENPFAVEYVDYQALDMMSNGNKTRDYHISLDFAKRLSMMAKTSKGEQIRKYFLECEKLASKQISVPTTLKDALLLAYQKECEVEALLAQKAIDAPKLEYATKVLSSSTTLTATQIAKELGMSAIELNKVLCEKGVQFKHRGQYILHAKYQNKGYTKTTTYATTNSEGSPISKLQLEWTEYGRAFIHTILNKELSFKKEVKPVVETMTDEKIETIMKVLIDYFSIGKNAKPFNIRDFRLDYENLFGILTITPIAPTLEGMYDGSMDEDIERIGKVYNTKIEFIDWIYHK